ncbi:glycosyltransferase [Microbacterium ulmi]|uniref:Glycosyltransferase n=1 Tax=Microbacterium ulmi TaxID=179095 RepID=A0A7Y2LZ13_9MICO|nr:glycosyltransferase involved in cell wall biosynthesis [Microbacterium ulmi]NNH03395.1 glycosyltransferase [Microbacterium ulmi]
MTPEIVLGQPALFRVIHPEALPDDLSDRESRLLVGAFNFHALMAPGRTLTVNAYDGGGESLPRLTDDATFDGHSRAFRRREFTVEIESGVSPEEREATAAEASAARLPVSDVRHVHVSRDDVLRYDPPRRVPSDGVRKMLSVLRAKWPLIYDDLRDLELLRHRKGLVNPQPRRNYEAEFMEGGIHAGNEIVVAESASGDAPRAVLLGLHWFELGGAERWAFETVRIVRDAGLLPIVLTNRDSHHAWIARSELDGAVVIPFSEPTVASQTPGVEELIRAILRSFDVRGVVVHHNQWLYDRLHWIVASRPGIPIIDSTHIVEYRGGGYPGSSVMVDGAITKHHVISPSLARWMIDVQEVPAEKVVLAPLGGLTVAPKDARFRPRGDEPFTVAFIGRMARQKAPEVFIETAKSLSRLDRPFRFVMHGDGDMATWVDDLIRSHGLEGRIVRRDSSTPVDVTLDEAHVLVVTSHNEGLTLTTLEAIAHGVPVISTDVGAQSDIIPSEALVPRNPHRAVRELARKLAELDDDEERRHELWRVERKAEKHLLSLPSATEWFEGEVSAW